MPKERNKADGYREKAYEGDTKAMNNLGVCYAYLKDVEETFYQSNV
jgi:TPR repeat protein